MYQRQRTLSRYGRPKPQVNTPYTFPASVGGINSVDSLMMMPPQDCIYTFNLVPSEYGLRLRKGYREWAVNCKEDPPRAIDASVNTVVPFESKIQAQINDRLFAVTREGIWDVTLFGEQNPTQEVQFPIVTEEAGFGVWTEFTGDAAGDGARGHYLFFAGEKNGIWQYEEQTDTWARPPSGTAATDWFRMAADGTTPEAFPVEDVAFVMVHKQRIWVILEDDDDAWYLPIASITGELKRFTFGSKLPSGGNLVGLWTWSIDGGDGVDDYMVAIGRGGDVVIYQGEDPEITPNGTNVGPWSTRGTWFIGEIPESRRIVAEYGPDLYILSSIGIVSMVNLLQGAPAASEKASPSRKISRFLRPDVSSGKDFPNWQLVVHPGDGFMQIVTPPPTNTPFMQYVQNLETGAWGMWEGVPMLCGASWNADYFMGGQDGQVYINDGALDGVGLPGFNLWQNVPVGAQPPEWTVGVNEYTCDGSQTDVTAYTITASETLLAGVTYQLFYGIENSPVGLHQMGLGSAAVTPPSAGNGIFSFLFTPSIDATEIQIIGDTNFIGTFTDVTARVAASDGEPIKFRTLTSFQAPQGHSQHARVGLIRSVGVLAGQASVNTNAVYDYKVMMELDFPASSFVQGPNVWNSAVWDRDVWDFVTEGASYTSGALGVGRTFAVGMTGESATRLTIVAWDLSIQAGGFL